MAFSDEHRTTGFSSASRSQQLQRDIPAQACVMSAVDVAIRTRADEFNDFEMTPMTSGRKSTHHFWGIGADESIRWSVVPVRTSDRVDLLEHLDERRSQVPSLGFGFPVDRLSVGHTQRKHDKGIVRHRELSIT